MVIATQNLSWKTNCKTPFFHSDCTFELTKNMFALYIKNIDSGPPL
jgi:hypothetical protein